jgi:hypothetical protein
MSSINAPHHLLDVTARSRQIGVLWKAHRVQPTGTERRGQVPGATSGHECESPVGLFGVGGYPTLYGLPG